VALQQQQDKVEGTLKRDSCFEVGWLISEHPAIVDYTQHSAYDPDPKKAQSVCPEYAQRRLWWCVAN